MFADTENRTYGGWVGRTNLTSLLLIPHGILIALMMVATRGIHQL